MRGIGDFTSRVKWAMSHPRLKRMAWISFSLLVFDLAVAAFFWGPAAVNRHHFLGGIQEYNRVKKEAEEAKTTLENYKALSELTKKLEAKWKAESNQASIVRSITRLAGQCGLKVVSQDLEDANNRNGQLFKQNISLSGSYAGLRRFISGLGELPTLTVVEATKLERLGETGDRLRAVLSLYTFKRSPGKGT